MNEDDQTVADSAALTKRIFLIHDMLPARKGLPGLTVREIEQRLKDHDIYLDRNTVLRTMKLVEEMLYVDRIDTDNGAFAWRRRFSENLTSLMRV